MKRHRHTENPMHVPHNDPFKKFWFFRKSQNEQIIMCTVSNFHLQNKKANEKDIARKRNMLRILPKLTAKNNNKWNVWLCSCMLCAVYNFVFIFNGKF